MKISCSFSDSTVHCKTFEDNSGAQEMASAHKLHSRMKRLNAKLRFFRDHRIQKEITARAIRTSQQLADCSAERSTRRC